MDSFSKHPLYRIHDLDSAMGSLWEFYKKYFPVLFSISLISSMANQIMLLSVDMTEMQAVAQTDPAKALGMMADELLVPGLILFFFSALFTLILQHFIIYKPLGYSTGKCITGVFRFLPAYLVVMILMLFFFAAALTIGFLALIIGVLFTGLYALMVYLFIAPVMLAEGPDIGNTISRTLRLAHRRFWPNLGWSAVIIIILIVIAVIVSALLSLPFSGSVLKSIANPEELGIPDYSRNPVFIVLSGLLGALTLPVLPIFAAILYFNGRAGEEENVTIPAREEEYRPTVEDLYSKPREENRDQVDK